MLDETYFCCRQKEKQVVKEFMSIKDLDSSLWRIGQVFKCKSTTYIETYIIQECEYFQHPPGLQHVDNTKVDVYFLLVGKVKECRSLSFLTRTVVTLKLLSHSIPFSFSKAPATDFV